jgi:hypothetical protein
MLRRLLLEIRTQSLEFELVKVGPALIRGVGRRILSIVRSLGLALN